MWYSLKIIRGAFAAAARNMMGTITHVETEDPVAALTFDDGPHPEFTPRLLDILERYQARATFFCVGKFAQSHPDIVQRAAQAGHAIGNHSWDHPSFPLITASERRSQIRACANAIAPFGQRLFRPPYGHQSVGSRLDAQWLGYQVVTWNVVLNEHLVRDADSMADWLVNQIQPGSVILLHDRLFDALEERYFDREPLLKAVNMLLERLGDRFRFITIPELLRHGRPQRQNWYRKADVNWLNKLKEQQGEARQYADASRCKRLATLPNRQSRSNETTENNSGSGV